MVAPAWLSYSTDYKSMRQHEENILVNGGR